MEDARKLIEEILEKGYLMSLATLDDGGVWVSDVIYVCDRAWNMYWLSQANARHSKAIEANHTVAATVTISGTAEPGVGLQIAGTAEKVDGDIFEMATKHRLKRHGTAPVKPGEILDAGESWYCLRPKTIELIHEPLLGFEKKKIEL